MLQHHHATPTKPARVVILGASDFVARHLAEEKIEYRAIASSEIDLLQPQSVAQLQSVFREGDALVQHLAAALEEVS